VGVAVLDAGTAFPSFVYRIEPVKAAEFARAIGDELRPLPGGGMEVPVGFLFFVTAQDSGAVFRAAGVGWEDVLFGGLALRYERPLRVGETLRGRTCVTEVKRRGELAFTSLETRYADERGELALAEVSTIVVRSGPPQPSPPPALTGHLPRQGGGAFHARVDRMAIAWMAVALEDPNPIHVEDEVARAAGFPSVIAHGTFPIGAIGALLTRQRGAGAVRSLDVRLVAPTYPGETVTAVAGPGDGELDVSAHAGDRVVARGRAEVAAR
jgi:acyl dehydratase